MQYYSTTVPETEMLILLRELQSQTHLLDTHETKEHKSPLQDIYRPRSRVEGQLFFSSVRTDTHTVLYYQLGSRDRPSVNHSQDVQDLIHTVLYCKMRYMYRTVHVS